MNVGLLLVVTDLDVSALDGTRPRHSSAVILTRPFPQVVGLLADRSLHAHLNKYG